MGTVAIIDYTSHLAQFDSAILAAGDKNNRRLKIKTMNWWPGTESNRRHEDFQSSALPTELPGRRYQMISRHPDATTRDLLPLTMLGFALAPYKPERGRAVY